jgi:hypothetical protein
MIFRSDVSTETLKRFFDKLEVDPYHGFEGTACVLWTGAKTCGQGKTVKYGAIKVGGRKWYVHRWAALHILQQEIDGMQVDHQCNRPLCVAHLQAMTPTWNRELQWIRVQVGIDENPRQQFEPDADPFPFYTPPEWYSVLALMFANATTEDVPF